MDTDNMTAQQFATALNERRAAEVAVIEAAREVIAKGAWWVNPSRNAEKFNTDATAALNLANTLAALDALDALDAPAPEVDGESH